MKRFSILLLILAVPGATQVLDVNNDTTVGAEEVLAVAENWKGTPVSPNDHNHLGQTWRGNRNPLTIRGSFPPRLIIGPLKSGTKALPQRISAPLILDNTATGSVKGEPVIHYPDLMLNGPSGRIAAIDESASSMNLLSNNHIELHLDEDNGHGNANTFFRVRNGADGIALRVNEDGDLFHPGSGKSVMSEIMIDHPGHPKEKYLSHSTVVSPEMTTIYNGNALLDSKGEAYVELPEYFESLSRDYRYQLTCIGGFAPVYIAEEIEGNRFRIAGGRPGMKVSWQVTGIRSDAYAKANPVEVEKDKSEAERGKFLHPQVHGEPASKSVMRVLED